MQPTLYVSHDVADTLLAGNWVDLLEAALPDAHLVCTSLPGYADAGAAPFGGASIVLGLMTRQALEGASVPFELGAAWAQGCRVIPVLQGDVDASALSWSLDPALSAICETGDHYLALLAGLTAAIQTEAGTRDAVVEALRQLVPGLPATYSDISGVCETRQGRPDSATTQPLWPLSEPPPAPDAPSSVEQAGSASRELPTCASSFSAGRALADCLFNAESGAALSAELDVPFGSFLSALGAPWAQLRSLEDGELWTEVANNLLSDLPTEASRVRAWYTIGYQLSNLLNLVHVEASDDAQTHDEVLNAFTQSSTVLRDAGRQVGFDSADLIRIDTMLDNLVGPLGERDYTLIARLQNVIREHADSMDADLAA